MTTLLLLNKIIQLLNIECVICYEKILNSDDLLCVNCCKNMYHLSCFNYNDNYECQMCANTNPKKIVSNTELLHELIKKYGTSTIIDALLSWHRICDVRRFDHELREQLGSTYIDIFGGCFKINKPEIYCFSHKPKININHSSNSNSNHKKYRVGDQVLCTNAEFIERFDDFSYGLFTNFIWPTGIIASGLVIPALIGNKTNNVDLKYIDIILIYKDLKHLTCLFEALQQQINISIGDIAQISYTIDKNIIYIKITGIQRVIRIETMKSLDNNVSLFKVMTSYSMSEYDFCQAYYNGHNIYMTIRALTSYVYQSSTPIDHPQSYITQNLVAIGYHVSENKPALALAFALAQQAQIPDCNSSINLCDLEVKLIPQDPTLIAEIKTTKNSLIQEHELAKIFLHIHKSLGINTIIRKDNNYKANAIYLCIGDKIFNYNNPIHTYDLLHKFVFKNLPVTSITRAKSVLSSEF